MTGQGGENGEETRTAARERARQRRGNRDDNSKGTGMTPARGQGRQRRGDDDDNHHLGTQDHHCKQLLAGWEQVLLQNERTATLLRRGKQGNKAQGTSFDVPWAVGKFFFLLISLFYC